MGISIKTLFYSFMELKSNKYRVDCLKKFLPRRIPKVPSPSFEGISQWSHSLLDRGKAQLVGAGMYNKKHR